MAFFDVQNNAGLAALDLAQATCEQAQKTCKLQPRYFNLTNLLYHNGLDAPLGDN